MKKMAIFGASALVAASLLMTSPAQADVNQNYTSPFSVVEITVDDVEVTPVTSSVSKVLIDALNVANSVEAGTPNSLNLGEVRQQVGSAFWIPTTVVNDFNIDDLEVEGDLSISGTATANRVFLGDEGTYRLALRQTSDANIVQRLDEDNFDDVEVSRDLDVSLSSINNLFAAGSDATVSEFELVQVNYDGWGNFLGQDIIASFTCGGAYDECEVEVDRNWDVSTFAGVNIASLSSAVNRVNDVQQTVLADRLKVVSVSTISDLDADEPKTLSMTSAADLNVLSVGNGDRNVTLRIGDDIDQGVYGEFENGTEVTVGVYDTDLTKTEKVDLAAQFRGNVVTATSGSKVVVESHGDITQDYFADYEHGAMVTTVELDDVVIGGQTGGYGYGHHQHHGTTYTAKSLDLNSRVVLNTVGLSGDVVKVKGEIDQNVSLDAPHVALTSVDDSSIRVKNVGLSSSIIGNLASFEGTTVKTAAGSITQNFNGLAPSVSAVEVTDSTFDTNNLTIGGSNYGNLASFR